MKDNIRQNSLLTAFNFSHVIMGRYCDLKTKEIELKLMVILNFVASSP